MIRESIKRALSLLFATLLLLRSAPASYAETEDSLRDRKGTAPAEGAWLDTEKMTNGSAYENPPTQVDTVRIGLQYGDRAEETADFYGMAESGFRFGTYDENRQFVERTRTNCSALRIECAEFEENGLMVIDAWEDEVLFYTGADQTLALEPLSGETGFRGNCYRGGFECAATENALVSVINVVGLEDYVKGVLPYEMANDWPMEALKAQAVCARTYVVYNQNSYEEYGFDLTDNTESQVYRGTAWENAWTDAAADATRGELIRYRGELCEIYYFAADGGATEDGRNVFDAERPYLCGKLDPFEQAVEYSFQSWTVARTGEEITGRLQRRNYSLETVTELIPEFSAVGNVIAITFVDEEGQRLRIPGRDCYTALGLYNCRFTIENVEDGFLFTGSGLGHNCGMSQWGARAMDETYGYNYREIIGFYYTGAYVA